MSLEQLHVRRTGMRWGRLLENLDLAHYAMRGASGQRNLLDNAAAKKVVRIVAELAELQQLAWEQEESGAK